MSDPDVVADRYINDLWFEGQFCTGKLEGVRTDPIGRVGIFVLSDVAVISNRTKPSYRGHRGQHATTSNVSVGTNAQPFGADHHMTERNILFHQQRGFGVKR
ncbi:hypothetical protein D9M73_250620 [compost metagenome]